MNSITISERDGVRNLHLGSPWVQGSMRISSPDSLELEYVRQMMVWTLFNQRPRHIVQLGLGAAALTKFCYRQFPDAQITAIELNREVIATCRTMFALPANDGRLTVLAMDAMDFVTDPANDGTVDVLQVDLYNGDARRPALCSPGFYRGCADCLSPEGIMIVNLLGQRSTCDANLHAIELAFEAVAWLPETQDGNIVAMAFKCPPQADFSALYDRAAVIQREWGLSADSWVAGLEAWMLNG